jgi:hypothetical protein
MEDESPEVGPGPLVDRIEGLEALVSQLRRELKRTSDARNFNHGDKDTMDPSRQWPSRDEQLAGLASLASWVDELQMEYAAAGDWLVPCWWRHGFAINELIALRTAWLGVDSSDEPSADLDWHEAAEKCRVRIHQSIGDGPGCTPVEHNSERPVPEDRRWIEERRLLSSQLRGAAYSGSPDGMRELSSHAS